MDCTHAESHLVTASVIYLEDTGKFQAAIKISCERCGRPFQFIGLPLGINLNGPAMDIEGQEARLAIAPVGSVPQPLDEHMLSGLIVHPGPKI